MNLLDIITALDSQRNIIESDKIETIIYLVNNLGEEKSVEKIYKHVKLEYDYEKYVP